MTTSPVPSVAVPVSLTNDELDTLVSSLSGWLMAASEAKPGEVDPEWVRRTEALNRKFAAVRVDNTRQEPPMLPGNHALHPDNMIPGPGDPRNDPEYDPEVGGTPANALHADNQRVVGGGDRCGALAKRGTGTGVCDRPMDEHGHCDLVSAHVDTML